MAKALRIGRPTGAAACVMVVLMSSLGNPGTENFPWMNGK